LIFNVIIGHRELSVFVSSKRSTRPLLSATEHENCPLLSQSKKSFFELKQEEEAIELKKKQKEERKGKRKL